jgi:hypothetical protein
MSSKMLTFARLLASLAGAQAISSAVMLAIFSAVPETSGYDASLGSYVGASLLAALFFAVPVTLLRAFDASIRMTTGLVGGLLGVGVFGAVATHPGVTDSDHLGAALIVGIFLVAIMVGIARLTVYGSDLVLRKFKDPLER